jgi:hypothetical protein
MAHASVATTDALKNLNRLLQDIRFRQLAGYYSVECSDGTGVIATWLTELTVPGARHQTMP